MAAYRRWGIGLALLAVAAVQLPTGLLRAEDVKAVGALDQGQRVFTAGHSFHVFLPNLLKDMAQSAAVKGHEQVGVQSLGGSRVLQHWDLPDDKNKAKEALKTGKVDVLTLSPIFHADEGIDHFTKLALEHNSAVRVTVQAFWLPYDTYAPDYQLQFGHSVATVETGTRLCGDDGRPVSLPCCCNPSRGGVKGPPVGQAVIALREKIIAGEAPGLKTQEDLFSDAIGHARPPLQALAAYCHFAVIYRRNPVGLPVPAVLKNADENEKLNRLLQELAWAAVTGHPLSGVKAEERKQGQTRSPSDSPPDFDRTVAPLLLEHCTDCHGGPRPKGGLDLTRKEAALKGSKGGPAVVPGKPGESLLWQRVDAGEMPPKKPLPEAARAVLRDWIAAGAAWGTDPLDPFRVTTSKRAGADWWSLRPVRRPQPPEVRDAGRVRNPIDCFVLARLDAKGLKPSPEADRRTLIRRLSLDLLGLPPAPEEVDDFLADTRADAYERLVDRLLASPAYGERWARHWLDVVRFGESDGFERNAPRPGAWHYRDWVIRALNDDLPYDDFCRLQIAGDALRPGEPDGARATGFLVAGVHNTVVPMNAVAQEAALQDELEDLVGSVGQTFLGLTAACARCHDHKFDPVPQKDYYRLASALSGVRPGERDVLPADVRARIDQLRADADAARRELARIEDPARRAVREEKRAAQAPSPVAAWDFRDGGRDRVGGLHVTPAGGARFTAAGLVVDGKAAFARSEPLGRDLREKTLEAWVQLDNLSQVGGGVLTVETPDGGAFDAVVFAEREPGRWMAGSDNFRRTSSFQGPAETEAGTRPVHVAVAYHADGMIAGYRDGKPYGMAYKSNGLAAFAAGKAVVAFGVRHDPPGGNRMLAGTVVQARLYDRALSPDEVAASARDFVTDAELAARLAPEARKQRDELRGRLAALTAEREGLEARWTMKVYAATPRQPAVTRLLVRGQVTDPGEVLAPGGLAALARVPADFGLSPDAPEAERRRRLAAWLTHPDNPLFARVMVNRLWHHHFGTGLVETPNDFGFNGGRPSHPELLDWLAAEFAARNFSLKALHRLMVTSSTYRQASAPRPEGLAADADDRLLWRKKPQRVEGEVLRDGMLAAAGLLNREVGGKGFSDYKEHGNAGTTYYDPIDPAGPAFHRRSVYRFTPRGGNQGLLDAFDCPDPAAAAPRRNTTTTPLQALALWNGAFALRMAEAFAARVGTEEPDDAERQVTRAYRVALQRDPLPAEREPARRLVEQHGLKALCRALFNTNEFLTAD